MGWILRTLLVANVLACTTYGHNCHPDNIRHSDINSKLLSLAIEGPKKGNLESDSDILKRRRPTGKIRASEGIFLTNNDIVSITTNVGSEYLLSILDFTVELLKTSNCSLELKGVGGNTLYKETVLTTKPSSNLVKFNLGDGILDVKEIILTFFAPIRELKIRNIFIKYCVQTGWCPWSRWKPCSKRCGGGQQFRDRTCKCPNPDPKEFKCPTDGPKEQSQKCHPECCEKPPTWSTWKSWGKCSTTCGDGTRSRKRTCKPDACPDDTTCKGKKKEKEKCYLGCCPLKPELSAWNKWSDCSATCGDSSRFRTRKCKESQCPGDFRNCPGPKKQTEKCVTPCCIMTIDFKKQMGTKVFRKNNGEVSVERVLRGGKKAIFLKQNDDQTQYFEVQLAKKYNIMVLGVSTLLASYVEVSSTPKSWPPGKAMSNVPQAQQIRAAGFFKHKIKLSDSGVGPIDNIKLHFGFPSGKIKVKNLYLVVFPA